MSRWPLEPLMALARNRDGERLSMTELSKRLGWSDRTVQGWQRNGIPTDEKAEAAAVAIGFDPANVWPSWYDAAIANATKRCIECDSEFVPQLPTRKFCSPTCRSRKWARDKYAASEEQRAKLAARRRAYYEYAAAYERRKERERYWANPEAKRQYAREYRARKKSAIAHDARGAGDTEMNVPGVSGSSATVAAGKKEAA